MRFLGTFSQFGTIFQNFTMSEIWYYNVRPLYNSILKNKSFEMQWNRIGKRLMLFKVVTLGHPPPTEVISEVLMHFTVLDLVPPSHCWLQSVQVAESKFCIGDAKWLYKKLILLVSAQVIWACLILFSTPSIILSTPSIILSTPSIILKYAHLEITHILTLHSYAPQAVGHCSVVAGLAPSQRDSSIFGGNDDDDDDYDKWRWDDDDDDGGGGNGDDAKGPPYQFICTVFAEHLPRVRASRTTNGAVSPRSYGEGICQWNAIQGD